MLISGNLLAEASLSAVIDDLCQGVEPSDGSSKSFKLWHLATIPFVSW